jgi:hypothetical protein
VRRSRWRGKSMVFMHVVTVIYAAKLEQVVENVQCKDTRTAQTSSFYNLTSPTRYRHAELPTDGDAT